MFSFLQHVNIFFFPLCSFFPEALVLRVLLPSLPTSELHYYQQSAFKSAPAQHQDVFCMLILRDTDPSLLRRSLMPGVPQTAGKTVSACRSSHTMGISGHHSAARLQSTLQQSTEGCQRTTWTVMEDVLRPITSFNTVKLLHFCFQTQSLIEEHRKL